jgi:hypothetical protein
MGIGVGSYIGVSIPKGVTVVDLYGLDDAI